MKSSPVHNQDHAAKMIRSLACQAEVEGYWAAARRRGLAPHELELLANRKRELVEVKAWTSRKETF